MVNKKILISGASIAGPVAAYWLKKYGFEVVLVERESELRLGGQNIDVKGPAREIIRKMELEKAVKQANTTEVGLRFVDRDDAVIAEFPKNSAMSMTQELEILRGDLVNILYDATKDGVEYRFGDFIVDVVQNDTSVNVKFDSGIQEAYDFLIIAEGIGSRTRRYIFGDGPRFVYLGLYTAYFTIRREESDTDWARWYNAPGGLVYLLRPDNHGTMRVCINLRSPERGYEKLTTEEQKEIVASAVTGKGWESERIIKGLHESRDWYMERLSQVKAPNWSKGRVAMIGDAAYCVTPIGGGGTDLAITGAYILAGELNVNNSYTKSFQSYEKKLRPLVDEIQTLPPGVPRLVYPTSKIGISILNGIVRIFGSSWVKGLSKRFGNRKKDKGPTFVLPEY